MPRDVQLPPVPDSRSQPLTRDSFVRSSRTVNNTVIIATAAAAVKLLQKTEKAPCRVRTDKLK